jgi:hypothetical protein
MEFFKWERAVSRQMRLLFKDFSRVDLWLDQIGEYPFPLFYDAFDVDFITRLEGLSGLAITYSPKANSPMF